MIIIITMIININKLSLKMNINRYINTAMKFEIGISRRIICRNKVNLLAQSFRYSSSKVYSINVININSNEYKLNH